MQPLTPFYTNTPMFYLASGRAYGNTSVIKKTEYVMTIYSNCIASLVSPLNAFINLVNVIRVFVILLYAVLTHQYLTISMGVDGL